jgi:hypothetical protein
MVALTIPAPQLAGGWLVQGQPGLLSETLSQKRTATATKIIKPEKWA